MLIVQNALISEDIADVDFCCDYKICLGKCCIEGDFGAPLNEEEIVEIKNNFNEIKKYLKKKSIDLIENNGFYTLDSEQTMVTHLNSDKSCVYSYQENGGFYCAIEKAHINNSMPLKKPISCHLYPLRITNYEEFDAINFHKWDICSSAMCKGRNEKMPLYVFLKEPLIRKYGDDWYQELLIMIEYYKKKSKS